MTNILDVDRLSVRFGEDHVLSGVSFAVPRGASVAIIGPNGAGKTVLFRALIGALPFEGSVRWAPDVRIGYVPQKLDIERDVPITGADFLRARAAIAGVPRSEIDRALALVGVSHRTSDQPIGALSGGQFQRLLVAFALVGHPNVLLLDEPTSGVDEPGQERLNALVHRLQREHGLTVLLISHELTIVSHYATAVLCVNREHTTFGPPGAMLTEEGLHGLFGAPAAVHLHDH